MAAKIRLNEDESKEKKKRKKTKELKDPISGEMLEELDEEQDEEEEQDELNQGGGEDEGGQEDDEDDDEEDNNDEGGHQSKKSTTTTSTTSAAVATPTAPVPHIPPRTREEKIAYENALQEFKEKAYELEPNARLAFSLKNPEFAKVCDLITPDPPVVLGARGRGQQLKKLTRDALFIAKNVYLNSKKRDVHLSESKLVERVAEETGLGAATIRRIAQVAKHKPGFLPGPNLSVKKKGKNVIPPPTATAGAAVASTVVASSMPPPS